MYSLHARTQIQYPHSSCTPTTNTLVTDYIDHSCYLTTLKINWNHRTFGGRWPSVSPAWYRSKWPGPSSSKDWVKSRETSVESVLRPRFELQTFRIQVRSITVELTRLLEADSGWAGHESLCGPVLPSFAKIGPVMWMVLLVDWKMASIIVPFQAMNACRGWEVQIHLFLTSFSGEVIPTRCNNCVYSSQWLYSTCFGWQFHPSSGVQCCIWPFR